MDILKILGFFNCQIWKWNVGRYYENLIKEKEGATSHPLPLKYFGISEGNGNFII